ncbi:MAG: AAA family ATPase [Thermoplasmata archaeon]|nr:AAA family ATPase [Thermoplasmata archaeon]
MALTGTPGTGKSVTSRLLGPRFAVTEVGDLANTLGASSGRGRARTVDLRRLARRMPRQPERPTVIVGHLAHLLPVSRAVLLRCHPLVLRQRLGRRRSLTSLERKENLVAEAIDLVRWEVEERGIPVQEIDATRRTPDSVARSVRMALDATVLPPGRRVDWLADPRVTEELLRGFR